MPQLHTSLYFHLALSSLGGKLGDCWSLLFKLSSQGWRRVSLCWRIRFIYFTKGSLRSIVSLWSTNFKLNVKLRGHNSFSFFLELFEIEWGHFFPLTYMCSRPWLEFSILQDVCESIQDVLENM